MLSHKVTRRTGSQVRRWNSQWNNKILGILLAVHSLAFAGEPHISAQVDRSTISKDDTVSLKISIKSDNSTMVGEPQFRAPDFEVVNEYNAISVSSQYDSNSGRFTMLNHQQITKVMRPLKLGSLKISDIRITAGGKVYKADDLIVTVRNGPPSGGRNAPPATEEEEDDPFSAFRRNPRMQRPAPRVNPKAAAHTFVRAEVNKRSAYKGEQIIVSYYLYRQVKVFNIQIDKFPVLNGFFREDLDIPVMNQRLDTEQVELNGELYERSLLAKYAAYPLESGKLGIDSISLKYNYYAGRENALDEEDPFFGFFQQLTPRAGVAKSDQVTIDVQPLPEAGKPAHFSGGIGDFTVTSAVDKYEVRANEAVTLTVKVEGNGNISNVQEPKTKWPENLELYDTKGRTQSGKGGGGTKVFEFLLIPRTPGKLDLPVIEFGFFDPAKKQYYTKSTDPIQLNVLEPAPGTQTAPTAQNHPTSKSESLPSGEKPKRSEDLKYLKTPHEFSANKSWLPSWRFLYWGLLALLGVFLVLVSIDALRRKKRGQIGDQKKGDSKVWDALIQEAESSLKGSAWQDVCQTYEKISDVLLDALDQRYSISSRSVSRVHLQQILVDEKGMSASLWERFEKLLEYSDLVRFASSAGANTETQARSDLKKWVKEGQSLHQQLTHS